MALLRETGPTARLSAAQIVTERGPNAALERRLGLFAAQAEQDAAAEIDAWRAAGIAALSFTDPRFPAGLGDMDPCPPLLFLRGELAPEDESGVAIIGTRQPSLDGVKTAAALAGALAGSGRTVVSGLAAGIDTAAHTEALRVGGRSIAVLGNGLTHAYPASNTSLQARMPALISQFWPEQPPSRHTFPLRNAVMSAISVATVIVEAGERSGARIQARHALAQGRRLFLMAPLLGDEWARTLASRAGVSVLNDASELVNELGDV